MYEEIAEDISEEVARLMHHHYKGMQICFPVRFYSARYVKKQLKSCGKNINYREMARKYGYSERWLRQMNKEEK
ncbi:Mor transcription activator family protein [Fusibacter sp. JL216-2]|uniref:Mor transcription activator family protein n=1 Tax=Fusibacter sp. JL216-2 TaxID=3071453 RepID=UPI003D353A5D